MEVDIATLMRDNPLLLTFSVICLGYLLGSVRIGPVQAGPTTGVLLAGLAMGHLGFPDSPGAATFGFSMFIFSVGLQAGPTFLSAFREDGRKYVALAAIVAATGVGLTVLLSRLLGLDAGLNAGLLAGAFTSTPTLAGAEDAIRSGLARLPEGVTAKQAGVNLSVAYAITYIFGTVGTILAIRLIPSVLKIDLAAEASQLARSRGIGVRRRIVASADNLPVIRAYRVDSEGAGKTIAQRRADLAIGSLPLALRRGHESIEPESGVELEEGDLITMVGDLASHREIQEVVGEEVLDPQALNFAIATREVVVSQASMVGKPVRELGFSDFGCYAVGLTRASIDLPVDGNSVLQRGDLLRVTGEEHKLRALAERLGYVEEEVEQTDLMTFAGGVVLGILLGLVVVKVGAVSVGLGSAGGLLVVGLAFGFLGSINPTFGRVPGPAKALLMELGLVLFMAGVGLKAGGGVGEALGDVGPELFAAGIVVTLVPIGVAYVVGRKLLDLNPALLLGSITGAMTSTPALNVITEATRSPVPGLGYAGTYTFANVLLTFAGTVLVTL